MSATKINGPKAPTFRHDVTFCGAILKDGSACHRLPAHSAKPRNGKSDDPKGHNAFVRGNGVAKPKVRRVSKPKASVKVTRTVTSSPSAQIVDVGGTKYLVTLVNGEAVLTKVASIETAKPSARKVTRRPKVVVVPEAPSERRVAASPRRSKTGRFVTSGKPSARLA